jgi:GH25 family lysozyme M1 (1,4-beta-N-acetylmuramidase)
MSMNFVDIASYQATLDLNNINYDGVAIKATEGTGYVNPDCDMHYQEAKAAGKKRAVYHFFDFGVDAIAQANYFVDNCEGYIREAVFVLDWEGSGVADIGQAIAFLNQVEARIGYKPAIYMSQYVENTYDWTQVVNNNNGLWLARYSNWELVNHAQDWDMSQAGTPPNVVHWPFYFMWQWTSTGLLSGYAGNLDCDIAYLTGDQWDAYAGVQVAAPAAPTTTVAPVQETTTEATTTASTTVNSTTTQPQETTTVAPPTSATTVSTTTLINDPLPPVVSTTSTWVPAKGVGWDVHQGVTLLEAVAVRSLNTFWQAFLATFAATALGLVSNALSIHTISDAKAFVVSLVVAVGAAALSELKNTIKPPTEVTVK